MAMKKIKNLWIVIGVIALIIFISQKQEVKKEAGEIVKFRTSSLTYDLGSVISFNLNCDGQNLEQHIYYWNSSLGANCGTITYNLTLENLPGNPSPRCVNTANLYTSTNTGDYIVCCNTGDNSALQWIYRSVITGTETSSSIDSAREINCVIPTLSPYQTFTSDKNDYIDGILDTPTFATRANNWITAQ